MWRVSWSAALCLIAASSGGCRDWERFSGAAGARDAAAPVDGRVFDGAAAGGDATPAICDEPTFCPGSWTPGPCGCYLLMFEDRDFSGARERCNELHAGADLLSIETQEEYDDILAWDHGDYYIGLFARNSVWVWTNEGETELGSVHGFGSGPPAAIATSCAFWNDNDWATTSCATTKEFACEAPDS